MYRRFVLATCGGLIALSSFAAAPAGPPADPAKPPLTAEQFEASLQYRSGTIELGDGLAVVTLPDSLRYLDSANTKRLLEEGWGNPDGGGTLGMILPSSVGPLQEGSWGVVVTYEKDGYVSDEDADGINYDDLLKDMRKSTAAANDDRKKAGYASLQLVGWAEPPHYDKASHKMHWAKEIAFEGAPAHTLNYNIRILGREGVLVLNAVSGIDQLGVVKESIPGIISAVDFKPGNSYADFNPKVDKVAAYGLAALIAGGVAAKTGLVAKLIALVLVFKKIVIGAVVVFFGALAKWFKKAKTG